MKLVDIDTVNPSSYNPRQADPRRLDLIERSRCSLQTGIIEKETEGINLFPME